MGVPGLIGVLERMFGTDVWIKQRASLHELAEHANVSGSKKIIAIDAMNFLFYLAGIKGSRGVGSDLSTYTGYSQRFDQVNDLSTSLVNAAMVNGESRTATVVFNESPNSTLDRLARLSLDLFETIPQSPNYEENTSNWNRYRVVHTPRLDPVFRNIPLTQ